jgi:hypothetical protein
MQTNGMTPAVTRRRFVGVMWSAGVLALLTPGRRLWASPPPAHPTPRPGITGEHVLTRAQLAAADREEFIPLFDSIRAIPQIVDGIRCSCGCTSRPGFYSLLSCYEGEGMARHCNVCLEHGKLVVRLHNEGKTLDQIRAAVDAKFG